GGAVGVEPGGRPPVVGHRRSRRRGDRCRPGSGTAGRRRRAGARHRGRLMAVALNIRSDRGLTGRMFLTGLLLVVLYGVFVAVLWAVGVGFGFIVAIMVVLLF